MARTLFWRGGDYSPHCFGKGFDFLESRRRNGQLSRDLAWDLLSKHGLKHASSFLQQKWTEKGTYRDWGVTKADTVSQETHAELDQSWPSTTIFKSITDILTRKDSPWLSQHEVIQVALRLRPMGIKKTEDASAEQASYPGFRMDRSRLKSASNILKAEKSVFDETKDAFPPYSKQR